MPKLTSAYLNLLPVVEVLSPGLSNWRRDRQAKLQLYSPRSVQEYWIVNYHDRNVEIYRHDGTTLNLSATLHSDDLLESTLLPGFSCEVDKLFL